MQKHTRQHTDKLLLDIAREFLEQRLGIEANQQNTSLFAAQITQFEHWVKSRTTSAE